MTRTTPTVSVVVPTYNGERFLGSTRDSLAAQRDVELIELSCSDDNRRRMYVRWAKSVIKGALLRRRCTASELGQLVL